MEKLSVSYSTISRVLINKTITRITKISFLKHFKAVSDLLEQPCNKSDNAIKLVISCYQLFPNLLQQH